MAITLTKQSIGYTSIIEILSSCDVSSPTIEEMRKSSNRVSYAIMGINQDQLTENRSLVKAIQTGLIDNPIRLQMDAPYNCALQIFHSSIYLFPYPFIAKLQIQLYNIVETQIISITNFADQNG